MKAKRFLTSVGFILIATTAWAQPDIKVRADNTELVSGSGSLDMGAVVAEYPATYFLIIENTGDVDLTLDATTPIAFCCTDPSPFFTSTNLNGQVIPPAGLLVVDINVLSTTSGAKGTIVTIESDDPDEGTYTFSVSAQVEPLPAACEMITGDMEESYAGSAPQGLFPPTGVSSYTAPSGWSPGIFSLLASVFGNGEVNVRTTADAHTGAQAVEVFSFENFPGDLLTSIACEAGTAKLKGYYKFSGAPTDVGMIAVSSGGGIEANRTETNSDTLSIIANASTYTLFEIDVPYDANSVDSVMVWFSVSAIADGASLKIDDLELITTPPVAGPPDKPAEVTFTSPTTTSVTVNWVEPDDNLSAITSYTLEQKEGSGGSFVGIYTGSNLAFAVSGLTPETSYFYRVRATNAEGDSDFSNPAEYQTVTQILMADGSITTCNAPFRDSGGSSTYTNNEDLTLTVSPGTPGQVVKISFTSFDVENGFDKLYVYDGPAVALEDLVATLTGSSLPSDILASGSGGELTFRFTSDGSEVHAGWEATFNCVVPASAAAPDKPAPVTFSALQSTSVQVHWQEPNDNGSAITGYTLQQKEGAGGYSTIHSGTGLFFDATGLTPGATYFYKVKATNLEGDSEYSDEVEYFAGTSILMATADVITCDAAFQDAGGAANYSNGQNQTLIVHPENEGGKLTVTFTSFELEDGFDKLFVYNGQSLQPGDLIATLTSSSLPGPITSSAPDGELTFNFVSDGTVAMAGWVATLTCSGAQSPDKPAPPTFGDITPTSIVVNWIAPGDNGEAITSYVLEQKVSGDAFEEIFTGDQLTFTSSTLLPATEYIFQVRAINANGTSAFSDQSSTTTDPDAPAQPAEVTFGAITPTSIVVNWVAPENNGAAITEYSLEQKTEIGGAYSEIFSGDALTHTATSLAAGTTYYFRVSATNAVGTSEFSNEVGAIAQGVPDAPTQPTFGTVTFNSIVVNWTAPVNNGAQIQNYILEQKEGAGAFSEVFSGDELTYEATDLEAGTLYTFRVKAVNVVGGSPFSGTAGTTTLVAPPEKPAPVFFGSLLATSVQVHWAAPDDNGAGINNFTLQQKTGVLGTYVTIYTGGELTFIATELSTGVSYFYRVKATNSAGDSEYSDEMEYKPAFTILVGNGEATTCDANFQDVGGAGDYYNAQDLTLTVNPENEGGKVTVTFTSFVLEDDFDKLYIYDGPTVAPEFLLATLSGSSLPGPVTSTAPGGELTFRFTTDESIVMAGWEATLTCSGAQAPDKPATPVFGEITKTSIEVNWLAPEDNGESITGYILEQNADGAGFEEVFNGNQVTFTSSSLQPGTPYSFRVKAMNVNGASAYSNVAGTITDTDVPAQPAAVTFGAITLTSIVVNWAAPPEDNGSAVTTYTLEQKVSGGDYSQIFSGNALTHTALGLEAGTAYYFRVSATNSVGMSEFSSEANTVTASAAPSAPNQPGIGTKTAISIEITWLEPANNGSPVLTYTLEQQTPFGNFVEIFTGDALTFTATGLAPNTQYTFQVFATNAIGDSPRSPTQQATTLTSVPDAPAAPTFGTVTSNSIIVNWTSPNNNGASIQSYTLAMKMGVGGDYSEVPAGLNTSYGVYGLLPGTTYYFKVSATNVHGDSPFSGESGIATDPWLPAVPAPPTFGTITTRSIQVNWSAVNGNGFPVTSYTLKMQHGSQPYQTVFSGDALTFTVEGLEPGITYYFTVSATNELGISDPSGFASAATPPEVPDKPAIPIIGTTTATAITVGWQTPAINGSGLEKYTLERREASAGIFAIVYEGPDPNFASTGLTPATQYAFRVKATNGVGDSPFSDEKLATTLSIPPDKPSPPSFGTITSNSIVVNWTEPVMNGSVLFSYVLERKTGTGGAYSPISEGSTATSFTDASLASSTQYYYRVKAESNLGFSQFSNEASATTLAPPKQNQLITFELNGIRTFGEVPFQVTATSTSGLPVTFTASGPILLTGNTVSIMGAGIASITATQAGNDEYLPASQVTREFTIGKASNTITFTQTDVAFSPGLVINLNAVASSGLPLNYSVTAGAGSYTFSGSTLTILAPEAFTITTSQPGNQNYLAAQDVTLMFCVNPPKPTISMLDANPENPILLSSGTNNQWYLNGSPINGARANTQIVAEDGTYQVATVLGACSSPLSDGFDIVITSTIQRKSEVTLYPNPARDVIILKGLSTEIRDVGIVGADGRQRVFRCKQSGGETSVDVTDLSVGIYLMRVADHDEIRWIRFLKE